MRIRKRSFVVFAIVMLVMVGALILFRLNQPIPQGRLLSYWLELYDNPDVAEADKVQARNAVLSMGTNAVPYLLETIRRDAPAWRKKLHKHASYKVRTNEFFSEFFYGEGRKADEAMMGFAILRTNATVAIPELAALFNDTKALRTSQRAMGALSLIGAESLPILTSAFADTNRPNRSSLLYHIGWMAPTVGTNIVLPSLLNGLNDNDPLVRKAAVRLLRRLAPDSVANIVPADLEP